MTEKKDKHFIKKPIYKGGNTAFRKFIKENLKYPKEALKAKIEGTVLVRYEIDYKGKVTDAKVKKGIGYGCDEEAMRVIKLLKFEVPKNPRKLRVTFHKENKINFKIPKSIQKTKKAPPQSTIQYTLTTKKKDEVEELEKKPVSYFYTIQY